MRLDQISLGKIHKNPAFGPCEVAMIILAPTGSESRFLETDNHAKLENQEQSDKRADAD